MMVYINIKNVITYFFVSDLTKDKLYIIENMCLMNKNTPKFIWNTSENFDL